MDKEQKNKHSAKLWITVGAVALGVILAVVLILVNRDERKKGDWATVIPGQTEQSQGGETLQGQDGEGKEDGQSQNDASVDTTGDMWEQGQDSTATGNDSEPIPTLGDEDPYEDCLASAMIVGISMQYSDYEFLGIYTASETPIAAHSSSGGAYVIFNGDGEKRALKAVPLSGERGERGTADIYVAALGYATYELVDPDSVPVGSLKERKLEELEDLILAYSQVSIIER